VDVTIAGPDRLAVVVGDTAHLTATASDPLAALTWTSSAERFAKVAGGSVVALRPGTALVVAAAGGGADTVEGTVTPRPGGYTADEVDYFTGIALGFEFGSASRVVRRWGQPVRFRVNGDPSEGDRTQLAAVVAEINALTSLVDMVEVDQDPLVEIHFAPVSQFPAILPSYVPGNIGFFNVWFDGTGHFTRAVVLIANDREQEVRDHLIREEVTQILGLGRDSNLYPESIFYQPWSLVSVYAAVDRALVEMLYRPEVRPLMGEEAVTAVLRRLTRGVVAGPAVTGPSAQAAAQAPGAPGTGSGGSR